MKKLIYIAIILLTFNSCKAQENNKMNENIIIPEITKEFEKINSSLFENSNSNSISIMENGLLKKYVKAKAGYSELNYMENSYFIIVKNFYPNGNINIKGIRFNNGSEYQIWYEFNKEGELIKEINTDEGYGFGWDKILQYCDENDIVLEKGYPKKGGIKTEIYKNEEDAKKVWTINYYDYKKKQYLGITLDGKTGKLIKEQELEFEGN